MSILDEYMKQYEEDKLNENEETSNRYPCPEEDREAYVEKLRELRQEMDPQTYMERMKKMTFKESEFGDNIKKGERIDDIRIIRAYCPKCGAELTTSMPPMYNPYNGEKQCIHQCKCGEKYNLEYCYPRIACYSEGKEINAFGF